METKEINAIDHINPNEKFNMYWHPKEEQSKRTGKIRSKAEIMIGWVKKTSNRRVRKSGEIAYTEKREMDYIAAANKIRVVEGLVTLSDMQRRTGHSHSYYRTRNELGQLEFLRLSKYVFIFEDWVNEEQKKELREICKNYISSYDMDAMYSVPRSFLRSAEALEKYDCIKLAGMKGLVLYKRPKQ